MDIIRVAVIGMAGIFLSIMLKSSKSEYAHIASFAVAAAIFAYVTARVGTIVEAVKSFAAYVDIEQKYIVILLKMTGITYVAEFAASLCRDAGHQAIASQIEIFAKLSLLAVSLPVVTALLDTISGSM
ncbi:MAG: stage III sporulation AC/AD family protein [Butyrivibrio sp.]|nr:stage III sporulation AC/AD family protein [Butyrivibrio sp.]